MLKCYQNDTVKTFFRFFSPPLFVLVFINLLIFYFVWYTKLVTYTIHMLNTCMSYCIICIAFHSRN